MADAVRYRGVFEYEDGSWTATSPDVPGAITWGRSMAGARKHLIEAIASLLDVEEEVVGLGEVKFVFPDHETLTAIIEQNRAARQELEEAQAAATEALAKAIKSARRDVDLSQRDAAEITGVSFQRVQQVEKELAEA
jgi:predicted RNase H-like HicB family nuclease